MEYTDIIQLDINATKLNMFRTKGHDNGRSGSLVVYRIVSRRGKNYLARGVL